MEKKLNKDPNTGEHCITDYWLEEQWEARSIPAIPIKTSSSIH